MKKYSFFLRMICAVFACVILMNMTGMTALAAPDGAGADDPVTSDDPVTTNDPDPAADPDAGAPADETQPDAPPEDPTEDPAAGNVTPTEPVADSTDAEPTEEPGDDRSTYTAPEHLDELPEAVDGDVVPATAVPVPQATVSNASLFSGIVMWLCVAVGIAVVVGVMVSKRTRRRGA